MGVISFSKNEKFFLHTLITKFRASGMKVSCLRSRWNQMRLDSTIKRKILKPKTVKDVAFRSKPDTSRRYFSFAVIFCEKLTMYSAYCVSNSPIRRVRRVQLTNLCTFDHTFEKLNATKNAYTIKIAWQGTLNQLRVDADVIPSRKKDTPIRMLCLKLQS